MRVIHGIREMTTTMVNSYRCDGGVHQNRMMVLNQALNQERERNHHYRPSANRGINMTSDDFASLLQQVTDTISSGVDRGLATAFNTTGAIAYYSDMRLNQPTDATRRVPVGFSNNPFMVPCSNSMPLPLPLEQQNPSAIESFETSSLNSDVEYQAVPAISCIKPPIGRSIIYTEL